MDPSGIFCFGENPWICWFHYRDSYNQIWVLTWRYDAPPYFPDLEPCMGFDTNTAFPFAIKFRCIIQTSAWEMHSDYHDWNSHHSPQFSEWRHSWRGMTGNEQRKGFRPVDAEENHFHRLWIFLVEGDHRFIPLMSSYPTLNTDKTSLLPPSLKHPAS